MSAGGSEGVGAVRAVIHFDGAVDSGGMPKAVLADYHQDNSICTDEAVVCVVTHATMDATGKGACKSLKPAGFYLRLRYGYNGAPAMGDNGRCFSHDTG